MKKFFCQIRSILFSYGKAHAASCLARHGKYEAAKRIMTMEDPYKC